MKRYLIPAVSIVVLAVAGPGSALAKHGHKSHGKHHGRVHHARVRVEHFGPTTAATTDPSDNAGTVTSFAGGVLTITLNDHSTVSGRVTDHTEIECEAARPTAGTATAEGHGAESIPSSHDHDSTAPPTTETTTQQPTTPEADEAHGDHNEHGDDAEDSSTPCGQAALVPGAVVHEAELRIGSAGAVFSHIELVH